MTSGVAQGSVLSPIMFLLYINDIPAAVKSYMGMLADDAKITRRIRSVEDCNMLQEDLNRIYNWSVIGRWNPTLTKVM